MTERQPAAAEPITTSSALLALLLSALWGGNFIALKLVLTTIPPFWSAWWRMLLAVIVLAAWARFRRLSLSPRKQERWRLFNLGLLFAAQIALLNLGANFTSPAYAAVLMNSHPIFSNLTGHFVSSEPRLNGTRILGLALALGGVSYLSMGQPVESLAPNPLLGNLLLVGSALLLGFRNVYTRQIVQSVTVERLLFWQMLISLPVFILMAALFEQPLLKPVESVTVMALLYQSIILAVFCFFVWTMLLRRHAAGTLAMFTFTVPLFGVLLSALIFSEPITGRFVLVAAFIMAGIILVTRPEGKAKSKH